MSEPSGWAVSFFGPQDAWGGDAWFPDLELARSFAAAALHCFNADSALNVIVTLVPSDRP